MPRRRPNRAMQENLRVAEKFWRYMKDSNQLLGTRTELRHLYKTSFWPALTDPFQRKVTFCSVMYCFRSKHMKIVEWKEAGEREIVVYLPGRKVAVDQSYALRREGISQSDETDGGNLDDFAELKKKLVSPRHRLILTQDKGGISILPEPDREGIVLMSNSKILQLTVTNEMHTDVTLRCAVLGWPGPFKVDHAIHQIVSEAMTVHLGGKCHIDFTVSLVKSANPGIYSFPVAFMFHRDEELDEELDEEEPFHIVKYLRAVIVDDVVTRLQPTTPYRRQRPFAMVNDPSVATERGEPPFMEMPDYIVRLQKYFIPGNLRHQMNISGKLQEVFKTFENAENCTPASHCEKFSKLLHVEELQMEVDIQKYQMEDAKLKQELKYLTLDVPGLAENRPSLVRGDRLFVRKLGANGKPEEKKKYEGYVHNVGLNKVFLKFSASFHRQFIPNTSYQVDFKFSRTTLQVMHRAIENAPPFLSLIPFDGEPSDVDVHMAVARLTQCYDQKIKHNAEQKQAVENILAGTSKPYPYLVFGPPGTGKTVTIVEAIKQVLDKYPNSKVLACAPSNSAADLILERVAEHLIVPKEQMVRLNAFGRGENSVNKMILDYCIRDADGFFYFPKKDEIENNYRFVVTTLISAGRLVSLGIPKSHFTHVFIDEAGQGMEPECLVPIVGLLETQGRNPGQLVLAGDPKQLGPVLRSPIAIKFGLGMSFLERLMGPNFSCFNRQGSSDQYDPKLVTKLLNNYRSHHAIIDLPNEMFYDDELRVCADEAQRNCLCHWSGLKKQGFPVIFEAVCGKDLREENSPSFFNPEEVSVVLRYVRELKEARGIPLKTSEIGIISPYHRQVQKIRQEVRKKQRIVDIKVGSVEEFQGQERKVIIISTVRSSEEFLQLDAKHKLGFLKNPKRFNVAITRAKALLIVIGNPDVLCHDAHWRKFIQYCMNNGSFSGGSGSAGSPFQMPEDANQTLAEKLAQLGLNENSLFEDENDLTGADYENRPWRSDEQ